MCSSDLLSMSQKPITKNPRTYTNPGAKIRLSRCRSRRASPRDVLIHSELFIVSTPLNRRKTAAAKCEIRAVSAVQRTKFLRPVNCNLTSLKSDRVYKSRHAHPTNNNPPLLHLQWRPLRLLPCKNRNGIDCSSRLLRDPLA